MIVAGRSGGEGVRIVLEVEEAMLLSELADQVDSVLLLGEADDPALGRLLPNAYPEDPPASISYPFDGYRSGISFRRQRTGERTFDLGVDGVAHYGLFADLLDEVGQEPDGPAAMRTLFRSAEAYLRMWERARSH